MAGEFFLWGGFVLGCLWHLFAWVLGAATAGYSVTTEGNVSLHVLVLLNVGISGVTLCAFGYLLFG